MTDGIVNIHGKEYQTVALRIQNFRKEHPDFAVMTDIIQAGEQVIMKATIANDSGQVLATGHAEEQRGSTQINKTSALENAETSAIGRALAAFGMGGTEFASANEVQSAIQQQTPVPFPDGHYATKTALQTALRSAVTAISKAETVADLKKIMDKAEAKIKPQAAAYEPLKAWWFGVDGDPERRGLCGQYEDKKAELENGVGQIVNEIAALGTAKAIDTWEHTNLARLDELPDAEREQVEQALDQKRGNVRAADTVAAG